MHYPRAVALSSLGDHLPMEMVSAALDGRFCLFGLTYAESDLAPLGDLLGQDPQKVEHTRPALRISSQG